MLTRAGITAAQIADDGITSLPGLFCGTGRVAWMFLGVNATAFNSFGDCAVVARFARRAGAPHYVALKEISTNLWLGTDIPSSAEGTAGVPYAAGRCIYKPMKKIRYDGVGVTDGDGGAVAYPQVSATQYIQFNVGATETLATRLGIIVGFTGDNCGIAKVELNEAVAGAVVPNLLPTAAQAATRGQISTTARDNIGAGAYVLGTSQRDVSRFGANRGQHIPIADNLAPGSYTIKLTYTGEKGLQQNTSTTIDRMYIAYATYGTAGMAHDDAGADLYLMDWLGSAHDSSSSETHTLGGRVTSSGHTSAIAGGGHGNERLSAVPVLTVDGVAVAGYAKSTLRARATNVATLTFDRPHLRTTGDVVTISGISGTGYNAEGVTVTVTGATTFTYSNTGLDEGEAADTGGRYILHKLLIGSTLSMTLATAFFHSSYMSGNTAVAVGTIVYTQDASEFDAISTITLSVNYDVDISTYLGLATFGCGSRTALGPEYGGTVTWKRAGTAEAGAAQTADNDAEVLTVSPNGYCMFGNETGYGAALIFNGSTPMVGQFVQDRIGGLLDKAYARANSPLTARLAGYVLTSNSRRFDGLFNPAVSYPALR